MVPQGAGGPGTATVRSGTSEPADAGHATRPSVVNETCVPVSWGCCLPTKRLEHPGEPRTPIRRLRGSEGNGERSDRGPGVPRRARCRCGPRAGTGAAPCAAAGLAGGMRIVSGRWGQAWVTFHAAECGGGESSGRKRRLAASCRRGLSLAAGWRAPAASPARKGAPPRGSVKVAVSSGKMPRVEEECTEAEAPAA